MIAIESLKEISKETGWDRNSQIIKACEFITSMDKDIEFKDFLNKSKEDETNLSGE